jgi:hypothetical protein
MRKKTLILAGIATLTAVTAVAAQQIPGIDAEAIERQAQKGSEALSGFVQQALERTPPGRRRKRDRRSRHHGLGQCAGFAALGYHPGSRSRPDPHRRPQSGARR